MRDFIVYLKDMIAAIESIESFVSGMDFESFRLDDKTASAVIRKFEIIGEAAKCIPDMVRHKYPKIPWKEMAGMRDRLIHAISVSNIIFSGEPLKNACQGCEWRYRPFLKNEYGF